MFHRLPPRYKCPKPESRKKGGRHQCSAEELPLPLRKGPGDIFTAASVASVETVGSHVVRRKHR